jgi:predicted Zn-dependent peptidase
MTLKFDPYLFEQKTIDGVTVLYKKIDTAPCIHIRLVFDFGAFSDPEGKEGVAHFLEHMLLKGCDTYPTKKDIREFSKKYMLNTLNATTGYFSMWLNGKTLPENYEKVIEGMFDMILTPKITQKDFDEEKPVITEEAWGRYKNDKYLNYVKQLINNNDTIPDRKRISSPLGWPETIERFTRQDILDCYEKNIIKENFSVVIVGNIDDTHIDILEKYIEQLKSGQKSKEVYIPESLLPDKVKLFRNKRVDIGLEDKNQVYLEYCINFPRIIKNINADNKNSATAQVFRGLLQEVLHERFRIDNSWCYSISASLSMQKDLSYLYIYSDINKDKEIEGLKMVNEILEDFKTDKYVERFEDSKKMQIDQTISAERLSLDIADAALWDYSKYRRVHSLAEMLPYAEAVTFEDIKSFAKENFVEEKIFVEVLLPSLGK